MAKDRGTGTTASTAYCEGHKRGAPWQGKALQRLLTHSFYGKCFAVKRVVLNKGAKTPGIDNVLWRTSSQRMKGAMALKRRGYKPQPLRRLYIPKKGGNKRPLSIPTMGDRAMQSLWKLALDPICEEWADSNAYGFRPKRCAIDAIEQCYLALAKKASAQWILEGDIHACFDTISHDWLLKNIPMDKVILRKFLKAGVMEEGIVRSTWEGTPQEGIISPTLTVMSLSGLETVLKKRFKEGTKVNKITYADDFIITGNSRELLDTQVRPLVEDFLQHRGLKLSKKKTIICPIEEGFDFLGFNIRKYNGKFMSKPSKASLKHLLKDVRETLKSLRGTSADKIIYALNPKITGWCSYFRHSCASRAFASVDNRIYVALAQWVHRRHTRESRNRAFRKYFKSRGTCNWLFSAPSKEKGNLLYLKQATHVKIKGFIQVRAKAHPFNPEFKEYFENRERNRFIKGLGGY